VFADLNHPAKKGLGNAFKWGNRSDPSRTLMVRAVMTDAGAVVAITDEGRGFDVPAVLARFRDNSEYFQHGGSGFSHFHSTNSVVSYADGGRTLLIRFLCAAGPGGITAAAPAGEARSDAKERRRLDFSQLAEGCRVKVKGTLRADGRFVADKVRVKAGEADEAIIDGLIRGLDTSERRIRVLNATVRLPDEVEITSPEQRRLGFGALQAGQVVELTGGYSPQLGFLPAKVQIRRDPAPRFEEIQGRIDEVLHDDRSFRVLGIAVSLDDQTEIKDKRS
jgi:hypothetical protein